MNNRHWLLGMFLVLGVSVHAGPGGARLCCFRDIISSVTSASSSRASSVDQLGGFWELEDSKSGLFLEMVSGNFESELNELKFRRYAHNQAAVVAAHICALRVCSQEELKANLKILMADEKLAAVDTSTLYKLEALYQAKIKLNSDN